MGNKIARTTQASASDFYLHDLPSSYNLVLKEVLCRGRFFKSIQCKHDEGIVLVKVYFKRGDFIDLREYERRLIQIKDIFRVLEHPHVWPFQFWLETERAAYLLRQYFFNNLHDRLGTRPFLSFVEKKWLAFQLLYAVKQCHENGVCHGDIKCENVLVTSWNWLYLADFASFKPTYIPHDDPSDFSFFFDTGGRRLCYLAPERFFEHGSEMQAAQDEPLKPSMDIFSVGCVIAELFLDGQPLFELSQLLAYRRGQYDPAQHLEKIQDPGIQKMILHMIQLDHESRVSAQTYLQRYLTVVFPNYFSPFLHNFYSCLGPLIPDTRVAVCQGAFHEIHKQMMCSEADGDGLKEAISWDTAGQDFRLLADVDRLLADVKRGGTRITVDATATCPTRSRCDGMALIASLLCSCVRNVKLPQLRRAAVMLLKSCSLHIDDEGRLQRVLPHIIAMLSDPASIVRCAALETLCDVLPLVHDFPPSDAKIFPEYIFPMLSMLPDDPEETVRVCYAANISKLALTAYRFSSRYDARFSRLRKSIADVIHELVMGPKQTPGIRTALLHGIGGLCCFFGRNQSNDFLLPILPAFLNDRDERLRAVFYRQIVYVCFFVGKTSVEEYLLPYVDQALGDRAEAVNAHALDCLTALSRRGFLTKRVLLDTIARAVPLLSYPSRWVRHSAAAFVASAATALGPVDSHVFLAPVVHPFLRRRPSSLASEPSLLSTLKPPVSGHAFRHRSSDMLNRQRKIWYNPPRDDIHAAAAAVAASFPSSTEGIPLYSFRHALGSARVSSSVPRFDDPVTRSLNLASSEPPYPAITASKQFFRVVHQPPDPVAENLDGGGSGGGGVVPASGNPDRGWRLQGVLVAHLPEHRSAVNDVAVSSDSIFLVTASDDSTVRVWDCRRLEKDVSFRSRMTYSLGGPRALCVAATIRNGGIVVGVSDGSLHLFSVEKSPGLRRNDGGGAVTSVSCLASDSSVLYSTKDCRVRAWDTRTGSAPWTLMSSAEEGYVSAVTVSGCGNWFVSGSSRGFLTLWDLRFLMPVNAWRYARPCVVERMCLFVPLPESPAPATARQPLVYVSAGCNEASLWNAENGGCHQIFRFDETAADLPWALARPPAVKSETRRNPTAASVRYRGDELQDPPPRLPGIRALLPLPGGNLITGGTDLKIRRWDHHSPDKSYCVCGPSVTGFGNDDYYEATSSFGVQVVQEMRRRGRPAGKSARAAAAADSSGCHRDAVLALASVKLNNHLLISSSRDGAVKVWR